MNVELTRFKVKENKSEKVKEWMNFLSENMMELEDGLIVERMYVETIFHEVLDGVEYLYWYSVQGIEGLPIEENMNWIAQKHLQYWDECIDKQFGSVDLNTKVVMIPKQVRASMNF